MPYLNFELNISELGKNIFSEILSGEYFKKQLLKNPPATLLEYSSTKYTQRTPCGAHEKSLSW